MDYAIEIQRIIDALKEDNETNTKWRRWVIAGLERLQPWCLMLYEAPSFSDPMPFDPEVEVGKQFMALGQNGPEALSPPNTSLRLQDIPDSLHEFIDPSQLKQPTQPPPPIV